MYLTFFYHRGIRAGYSFSFLEVIVGCEILDAGNVTCEHDSAGLNVKEKKLIYLHLKKFFRGARFASPPFLRSLQEKHKIGDVVCVSGKVSALVCYFMPRSLFQFAHLTFVAPCIAIIWLNDLI